MRATLLILFLITTASADDWLFPRGDVQNTGVVKNKGPKKKPSIKWQREEKGGISTGAALSGGRLVFGVGEFVVACRRASGGAHIWDAKVKQQVVSWPLIREEICFFGGQDTVHYRIKMSTGGEETSPDAKGAIVAPPTVRDDHYFAGGTDGTFYAIGSATGRVLWSHKIGAIEHAAALDKKNVYVATTEGKLFAFNIKKGTQVWKYESLTPTVAAPIVIKGYVLLPVKHALIQVNPKSGEVVANHAAKGIAGAPAVKKTVVHYGTEGGEVVVFDLKSLKELARIKVGDEKISAPLILAGKALFGVSGTKLFCVDPKARKRIWEYEGPERFQPPIVAGGAVYVGAGNVFYCLK
ncbi:MAG: PQQ-binding-like beta-propeller repeat protein [Planctomycetota bacterium]